MKVPTNVRTVLGWALGLVFVSAALSKLVDTDSFNRELEAYRLPLAAGVLRLTALVLPWLELACGLMVLVRLTSRAALYGIIGLCLIFLVCTGQAWARGLKISCGCLHLDFLGLGHGGAAAASVLESVQFAFVRAWLLLAAALFLLRREKRPVQSDEEK